MRNFKLLAVLMAATIFPIMARPAMAQWELPLRSFDKTTVYAKQPVLTVELWKGDKPISAPTGDCRKFPVPVPLNNGALIFRFTMNHDNPLLKSGESDSYTVDFSRDGGTTWRPFVHEDGEEWQYAYGLDDARPRLPHFKVRVNDRQGRHRVWGVDLLMFHVGLGGGDQNETTEGTSVLWFCEHLGRASIREIFEWQMQKLGIAIDGNPNARAGITPLFDYRGNETPVQRDDYQEAGGDEVDGDPSSADTPSAQDDLRPVGRHGGQSGLEIDTSGIDGPGEAGASTQVEPVPPPQPIVGGQPYKLIAFKKGGIAEERVVSLSGPLIITLEPEQGYQLRLYRDGVPQGLQGNQIRVPSGGYQDIRLPGLVRFTVSGRTAEGSFKRVYSAQEGDNE